MARPTNLLRVLRVVVRQELQRFIEEQLESPDVARNLSSRRKPPRRAQALAAPKKRRA